MPLSRLVINDFRNITVCDIELSPRFNFITGLNGSGKTSILEAIYLLGHGRSFKSSLTSRIIKNGCDELFVHGRFSTPENTELPIGINKQRSGTTEVKIGGEGGQKLAQLARLLPLQLIHPEGFDLITDGPKRRRAFIDWGVFHVEPAFFQSWSRVKRLTKQRNALLKTASHYKALSYWDRELAELAEKIDEWRADYIEQLSERALQICQLFLPEYEITLSYYRGWERETPYAELLERNFERDKQLGYTVGGPNKADLRIKIAGTPVEDVLSRGQLKLMVCALRLAQGQHLSEITGKQSIYLIDDFASELDGHRRQLLSQYLKQIEAQVFISSITVEQIADMHDDIIDNNGIIDSSEKSKMFEIEHGKVAQR